MITTDAQKCLPQMGLDPLRVVGCAAAKCRSFFALANGFADQTGKAMRHALAAERWLAD
jgi:hypothetical protein